MSTAASSSGTCSPRAADQLGEALRGLHQPTRYRPLGRSATFAGMFPGAHAATTPDKPAVIMGETGAGDDLRRARRRRQPAEPAALRRRAPPGRPRRHAAWRTTPATSRSSGAATTPGSSTPPARPASPTPSWPTSSTTAAPGLHHLPPRPSRRPRSLPETPDVELRLMLDGVIEGYQSYEDAVAAQPAEPLADRDRRAPTCSTRRAPRAGPRG